MIVFGDRASRIELGDIPAIQAGPFHTNTCEALEVARGMLASRKHPNKQIFLITDGKPSAITEGTAIYKNPIGLDMKIVNRTLEQADQCRRQKVVITTFMIATDPMLQDFVEKLTRVNRGRAYFANPYNLGGVHPRRLRRQPPQARALRSEVTSGGRGVSAAVYAAQPFGVSLRVGMERHAQAGANGAGATRAPRRDSAPAYLAVLGGGWCCAAVVWGWPHRRRRPPGLAGRLRGACGRYRSVFWAVRLAVAQRSPTGSACGSSSPTC